MSATIPPEQDSDALSGRQSRIPELLVASAISYWLFQVVWFWRYCARQINIDAVSYIGIARHISDGNFLESLHGYWSPLVSWLIAAFTLVINDRTLAARLLMLPAFLLCMFLVHRLTSDLWGSRLLSGLAVLWFAAARGLAAFSVSFIGADLLLTAAVLGYFILLLRCLRQPDSLRSWFALGVLHGIAFLAKAIAMPLLAGATILAAISSIDHNLKQTARHLAFAAIFPILIWVSWGAALHAKYGVFTTGYQLRWNLFDPALRQASERGDAFSVLHDTRSQYDGYMVTDAMHPGSPLWHAPVWRLGLISQILQKEMQNVPQAVKEIAVLLTPGGMLAFALCIFQLVRERERYPAQFRFIWIVLLTTVALIAAYCMLVFDGRYVLPITPVLIALAVRHVIPASKVNDCPAEMRAQTSGGFWQTAVFILFVVGLFGVQVYKSSPFRTVRQDFQLSVYSAADVLRKASANRVVAIGSGPYQDHGVGWEAGVYTAYFAQARIVAELYEPPRGLNANSVASDVEKLAPDAVMVWGTPSDDTYSSVLNRLKVAYPAAIFHVISDPHKGNVGGILLLKPTA